MKIALLSESLPPSASGQAVVLRRLLGDWKAEEYCLLSQHAPDDAAQGRLPGRHYQYAPHSQLRRGHRFGLARVREALNISLGIRARARQVTEIARRERCTAVVACTGDIFDLPAGYLAARRLGLPFYPYIFDHYSYREWRDSVRRFLTRRMEPVLLKGARRVIVPNEVLGDDLRKRYGVDSVVIHNSFDIKPYEALLKEPVAPANGEVKIVYTGDIYEAHYDAFRNLLGAIELLGRGDVKLHVYTSRPIDELVQFGIRGPIVRHEFKSATEVPRIQREADLLFLPLAFSSPYPELVRTSATTKLGEYLAAGRPVLVHAPKDSFVAWYFRTRDCGLVVDRPDAELLAGTMRKGLEDAALQQRLGARAWECARTDFDIATAQAKFRELLMRSDARTDARAPQAA